MPTTINTPTKAQLFMSLNDELCPIHQRLAARVASAVAEVYRLKNTENPSDIPALNAARAEERDAVRELSAHIKKHRCKH